MINIRTAVSQEVDALLALLIDTIKSTCKTDYSQEQIDAWIYSAKKEEHWNNFINHQFSLVAEINNEIVGFGSLENGNHIYFMYVHKDYLGLGVASSIYKQLEKESRKLGYSQISADVSKTAVPFFASKGFEMVKENQNIINEVTIINYRMVNHLLHEKER